VIPAGGVATDPAAAVLERWHRKRAWTAASAARSADEPVTALAVELAAAAPTSRDCARSHASACRTSSVAGWSDVAASHLFSVRTSN
jgi:hypothetical protein